MAIETIQSQANKTINTLKQKGVTNASQITTLEKQLKESQEALKSAQSQTEENAKRIATLEAAKKSGIAATAAHVAILKSKQKAELEKKHANIYEKQQKKIENKQSELQAALTRAQQSEEKLTAATRKLEEFEAETAAARAKIQEMTVQTNQRVQRQINDELKQTKDRVLTSLGTIKKLENAEKQKKIEELLNELQETKSVERVKQIETEIIELLDKPQILLLLNKIRSGEKADRDLNRGTLDTEELIGDTRTAKINGSAFIRKKLKNFRSEYVNVFFNGPSGSGKTTLFEGFTGKNLDKNTEMRVTAYVPTFTFTNGILEISDKVVNITYGEFKKNYIRSTPFNPQSSRAHMSYEITTTKNNRNSFGGREKLRVFDLAGAENPMAIMFLTFGFNIFDKEYMSPDSWKNMSEIPQNIIEKKNKEIFEFLKHINSGTLANFLTSRKLTMTEQNAYRIFLRDTTPRNSDGLSKLAETFIFWLLYGANAKIENKPTTNSNDYIKILKHHRHKKVIELKQNSSFYNRKIHHTYDDMIVCKFLYESFKRMIEGFYITRSLFSLRYAFTSASAKISDSLTKLREMKVNSKHIAPFTNSQNSMSIDFKDKTLAATISEKFKNSSTPFVPIPENMSSIKYGTKFLNEVLKEDGEVQYKNLIVGVVNGNPPITTKDQQQVAINYLKTLTPTGGSIKK